MGSRAVKILCTALASAALVVGTMAATSPAATGSEAGKHDDASKGLVYEGLNPGKAGTKCEGKFEMPRRRHNTPCSHGPDAAPPGVDARYPSPAAAAATSSGATTAAAASPVGCYGDGQSGDRIEAIYAHPAGVADRYSSLLPSMQSWAAAADTVFNQSAAETGGVRHLRFVTDPSCNVVVDDVQLTATGGDSLGNTINELLNLGYNRSDRKYLVWVDKNVYCGIAEVIPDDSGAPANANNGSDALFARVDPGCWGLSGQSVEAHELMHTLGGVQTSAPHATAQNHCWDDSDRMCYDDYGNGSDNYVQYGNGSYGYMQQICPSSHENLFDCNHDDYYSTSPAPGSYLATHWNTANSSFLATSNSSSTPQPAGPGWHSWESLGAPAGGLASGTDVASWGAGRLDVFGIGPSHDLQHTWFDGAWHGWESLGGYLTSDPTAVAWSAGRLDVFARGGDNALWHLWFNGAWHGWESLGSSPGGLTSGPDAASWTPGRLDVFARGAGNGLVHQWFDGAWHQWESFGGSITSDPTVVPWAVGRLDIFARGGDNSLSHIWFDGGWHGWESLGAPPGGLASSPDVASWAAGRLDVFARGTDNSVVHQWFDGAWHSWESLGGALTSDPGAISWGVGRVDVFGRGASNSLTHNWYG